MRSRILPFSLIFVGFGLAIGWCVMFLPALFMAESGAGLAMGERALGTIAVETGAATTNALEMHQLLAGGVGLD